MDLRHYPRDRNFELDRDRDYKFYEDDPYSREAGTFKPKGLWVSVNDDYSWKNFCEDENFLDETVVDSNTYTVTLNEKTDILMLSTPEDLRTFTLENAILEGDRRYERSIPMVDWVKVQREHGGVIIYPYQYTLRWHLRWYTSWDCASGAIWNLDNIKDITKTYPNSK